MQAFRAVPVRGDGASTRVYALESTVGADMRPGPVQSTGRALDVAMQGNAWLAVQSLDGTEAYTRAGSLQVNAEGQLVTPPACPCWATAAPSRCRPMPRWKSPPTAASPPRWAMRRPQQAGKLKLVTPETPLQRGTDGLFRGPDGDLTADPTARVQGGALEGSNVSAVETMVAMIAAARQFEQQMKSLQGAEQREQAATKLLAPQ
jgi:flagellar basal-body rod protein FlgF